MFKKIIKHTITQNIIAYLGAKFIKFIYKTTQWNFINLEILNTALTSNRPVIVCCWHQRLLMIPSFWHFERNTSVLLSSHSDGLLISKVLKHFKVDSIYGSSTRGGDKAALQIIRKLKKGGVIGITPDGPKGPNQVASLGVAQLAYLSQAIIVPIAYSVKKHKKLRSWDQFMIPLPFSKGRFCSGDIIDAKNFKSVDVLLNKIQSDLDSVTCTADAC